jgi:hypothetical protein
VSVLAGVALWIAAGSIGLIDAGPSAGPPPASDAAMRLVLSQERFPWYDAQTGRVKPILPWPDYGAWKWSWFTRAGEWFRRNFAWLGRWFEWILSWFRWLNRWRVPGIGGAGDLVAIGLAMLLLALVVVGLLELLRRYRPLALDDAARRAAIRAGSARRIEGLPAGMGFDAADPWAEAQRLRARGDYASAVVYLFAHQLLTLDRTRQLRLVPGRTGRQLVRTVGDRELRGWVEQTLWLFESVYYGHHAPSADAFDSVWTFAEAFEQRIAAEATP